MGVGVGGCAQFLLWKMDVARVLMRAYLLTLTCQCRKCNYEWCWLCNGKYVQGHFRNGSCEQFSQDFFDELDLTREDFDANYVVMNHW